MTTPLAETLISEEEGRRKQPYYDSLGFATVGVGRLCDPRKPCAFPEEVIDLLLQYDIANAKGQALLLSGFSKLNEVRQAVLIAMVFQLGYQGVLKFKHMLQAIEKGDFKGAAQAGLESAWADQTPKRATRAMKMLETGEWLEHG